MLGQVCLEIAFLSILSGMVLKSRFDFEQDFKFAHLKNYGISAMTPSIQCESGGVVYLEKPVNPNWFGAPEHR